MLKNLFDKKYYITIKYWQIYIKYTYKIRTNSSNFNNLKFTKIFLYNKFYKIRKYKSVFAPKFQYTNKIY